jgi:hypothetical protein
MLVGGAGGIAYTAFPAPPGLMIDRVAPKAYALGCILAPLRG